MSRTESDRPRERRGTPVLGEEHPYATHLSPPSSSLYVMEPPPQHGIPDAVDSGPHGSRLGAPAASGFGFDAGSINGAGGGPQLGGFRRTTRYAPSETSSSNNNYYPASNSSVVGLETLTSSSAQQPLITTPRATQNNIIRVINKDMTSQFRGRTQSVSNARIRWFENRKSQLLGCCLTMAFLGLSIALYDYRWMGLIAGSVNTIICGSAVVLTYCRKKRWHQHPNPIVHLRSVLSIFLAICLLLNVLVDFDPKSDDNANCRGLAGITEFFFFTGEAWGLVMACDLFFSVSAKCLLPSCYSDQPTHTLFSSPSLHFPPAHQPVHELQAPHALLPPLGLAWRCDDPSATLAWLYDADLSGWRTLSGIVMGAITYGVTGAGGFFTVDGQAVKYHTNTDSIVGFCLASSRICCETGQTCASGVAMCSTNSSFMNAQQWYDSSGVACSSLAGGNHGSLTLTMHTNM